MRKRHFQTCKQQATTAEKPLCSLSDLLFRSCKKKKEIKTICFVGGEMKNKNETESFCLLKGLY